MNSSTKSALFRKFILMLGLLSVNACDAPAVTMPHVFSGNEVPPDIMAQPRVVAAPSPELQADKTYPLLGNVPSMPKNFTSPSLVEATKQQLENERDMGKITREQYSDLTQSAPTSSKASSSNSMTP